ncbi:MAG: hypothetical protein ABW058_03835 [Methylobacterium sp.]
MISPATDPAAGRLAPADLIAATERVFAEELRDFIGELCLLDGGVLIGWVRGQHHGNIADLVASSAEPFFKDATLAYADAADVTLAWGRSMQVVLDMEFVTKPVTVFFKLILDSYFAGVTIQRIMAGSEPPFTPDILARALSRARL